MTQFATEGAALCASALETAAQEVLGLAWGCVPDNVVLNPPAESPDSALSSASRYGSALPLSVAGLKHELRLEGTTAVVAGLLPRMLGRAASTEEVDGMAEELLAELVNQVAGHLAGLVGEGGMDVELGTPSALAAGENPTQEPAGREASAPVVITRWTYAGQPLVLSLYSSASSSHE
jgi:hypothetical protein